MLLQGKTIVPGEIRAYSTISLSPISFLGDIDPKTGKIVEKNNLLFNQSIAGKVFVFPYGKGSTVGSYVIYQLRKNGMGPVAIINNQAEAIIAVGAIISDIPMIHKIDIEKIPNDKEVVVNATEGYIEF